MYGKIIEKIKQDSRLPEDSIHQESHWERVAIFGSYIAEKENLNHHFLKLFAYFHDSRRYNDSYDPEHGPRAVEYLKTFKLSELDITETEHERLIFACRYHTYEKKTDDKDILACWDSDRLDLSRAGIKTDPERLFTKAAEHLLLDSFRDVGVVPPNYFELFR